ncbi:hypothetical protein BXY66_3875 [Shimia isoporae]|uniref:Uncharacterized protein n=1 Tax=Shimia isoporae TaxID=647720 RepID=A0A4R1N509_9RHOB|nr:hypothetical protein BXY66_3875 [Shimia isoporae]
MTPAERQAKEDMKAWRDAQRRNGHAAVPASEWTGPRARGKKAKADVRPVRCECCDRLRPADKITNGRGHTKHCTDNDNCRLRAERWARFSRTGGSLD